MESVLFKFFVAFNPTKKTFTTDVSIWKKPLFSQKKRSLCSYLTQVLMPLRACPKVWSMIKTSLCKKDFLLWFGVSKSSLGMERRRLKRSLHERFRWLNMKRIPNRKTLTGTVTIAAQFPTSPITLSFSCFHKLYISFFVLRGPTLTSIAFWYTNLLETLQLVGAWLQDSFMIVSSSSQDKMPDNFNSVVHFNNSKGLRHQSALLLSGSTLASPNKHAWETGKPKTMEITANFGMRKLALKSKWPPFSIDFWKSNDKCN